MINVFLVVAWDKGHDMKIVTLCKTQEMAQQVQTSYKQAGWTIVDIHELPVYDDFPSYDSWEI